jgi:hypothetical protein
MRSSNGNNKHPSQQPSVAWRGRSNLNNTLLPGGTGDLEILEYSAALLLVFVCFAIDSACLFTNQTNNFLMSLFVGARRVNYSASFAGYYEAPMIYSTGLHFWMFAIWY